MLRIHVTFVHTAVSSCCADPAAIYASSGGPVYVNPNHVVVQPAAAVEPVAAVVAVQPTQVAQPVAMLTQTVYGFLDFTTTIGNTVMVFSPQSAPAAAPPATGNVLGGIKH